MRVGINRRWSRPTPIRCRSGARKMSPHTIFRNPSWAPVGRLRPVPRGRRFPYALHSRPRGGFNVFFCKSSRPRSGARQLNLSRRRRTLPLRAPQRTRLLGNWVSAYATLRVSVERRIRSCRTLSRLAPSARGCERLICAPKSTVVARAPCRSEVDQALAKCRRTRFLGIPS